MPCLGNSFLPVKRLLYSISVLHCNQSVPTMADLLDEQNENDQHIIQKVKKFLQEGCGCSRGAKDGHCSEQFSEETVLANLNNCLELSSAELDLVILANIQAFTRIETIGEKRIFCINQYLSLQGYVSPPLRIELLLISTIEGTLRESWHFTKNAWQLQRLPSNTLP